MFALLKSSVARVAFDTCMSVAMGAFPSVALVVDMVGYIPDRTTSHNDTLLASRKISEKQGKSGILQKWVTDPFDVPEEGGVVEHRVRIGADDHGVLSIALGGDDRVSLYVKYGGATVRINSPTVLKFPILQDGPKYVDVVFGSERLASIAYHVAQPTGTEVGVDGDSVIVLNRRAHNREWAPALMHYVKGNKEFVDLQSGDPEVYTYSYGELQVLVNHKLMLCVPAQG